MTLTLSALLTILAVVALVAFLAGFALAEHLQRQDHQSFQRIAKATELPPVRDFNPANQFTGD